MFVGSCAVHEWEVTARPEGGGDSLGYLQIPPATTPTALHVGRPQWPFVSDTVPESGCHVRVLSDDIAPPRVVMKLASAERECRVQLHGNLARFVAPVLEQRCARLQ